MSSPEAASGVLPEEIPIPAFAVLEEKGDVVDWSYVPLEVAEDEVELHIEACGVCHSDLNQQKNYWGWTHYPLVPGHEIIGTVSALGSAVQGLKLGQRVGVGPQVFNCGACDSCSNHLEQCCAKKRSVYNTPTRDPERQARTYGGFSHRVRVHNRWALPIPDALPSVEAAPLLCAGLTTWSPLVAFKVGPGQKVGIVGIGGLGHLAVQFAAKLGAQVTAISRSDSKKEEALGFGASSFLSTSSKEDVAAANATLDFLLVTVSTDDVDWNLYFSLLKPGGTLCLVGLPNRMDYDPALLVLRQLRVVGANLCNNEDARRMLDFCAKYQIHAQVEWLPMSAGNANLALEKVERNEPRYRMVLVNEEHPNYIIKQ